MASLEAMQLKLESGQNIVFRTIGPDDAERFLSFLSQIPLDSRNTMLYHGQKLRSLQEERERLASALSEHVTLNIGAFDGEILVGYLNFRSPYPGHPSAGLPPLSKRIA
jgi:hypothetical protein